MLKINSYLNSFTSLSENIETNPEIIINLSIDNMEYPKKKTSKKVRFNDSV